MKNKDYYNLQELIIIKRRMNEGYQLVYKWYVYKDKEIVAKVNGGALSDILCWLEEEHD